MLWLSIWFVDESDNDDSDKENSDKETRKTQSDLFFSSLDALLHLVRQMYNILKEYGDGLDLEKR